MMLALALKKIVATENITDNVIFFGSTLTTTVRCAVVFSHKLRSSRDIFSLLPPTRREQSRHTCTLCVVEMTEAHQRGSEEFLRTRENVSRTEENCPLLSG